MRKLMVVLALGLLWGMTVNAGEEAKKPKKTIKMEIKPFSAKLMAKFVHKDRSNDHYKAKTEYKPHDDEESFLMVAVDFTVTDAPERKSLSWVIKDENFTVFDGDKMPVPVLSYDEDHKDLRPGRKDSASCSYSKDEDAWVPKRMYFIFLVTEDQDTVQIQWRDQKPVKIEVRKKK